jgi:tRNA1(Val) A37 N6-methylase TrmN6
MSTYAVKNNGKLNLIIPQSMLNPVMYKIKKHNLKNIIVIPFQIKDISVDSK